jgi:hypothetical protein
MKTNGFLTHPLQFLNYFNKRVKFFNNIFFSIEFGIYSFFCLMFRNINFTNVSPYLTISCITIVVYFNDNLANKMTNEIEDK